MYHAKSVHKKGVRPKEMTANTLGVSESCFVAMVITAKNFSKGLQL
jgi:hypothetical protein